MHSGLWLLSLWKALLIEIDPSLPSRHWSMFRGPVTNFSLQLSLLGFLGTVMKWKKGDVISITANSLWWVEIKLQAVILYKINSHFLSVWIWSFSNINISSTRWFLLFPVSKMSLCVSNNTKQTNVWLIVGYSMIPGWLLSPQIELFQNWIQKLNLFYRKSETSYTKSL